MGIFWKCARIGERLSPYISICCVIMAVRYAPTPIIVRSSSTGYWHCRLGFHPAQLNIYDLQSKRKKKKIPAEPFYLDTYKRTTRFSEFQTNGHSLRKERAFTINSIDIQQHSPQGKREKSGKEIPTQPSANKFDDCCVSKPLMCLLAGCPERRAIIRSLLVCTRRDMSFRLLR